MHSSPYPEPPKLSARPGPVLLPPRPRSTSVQPIPTTVQKMAKRYMPVTENVTPPSSPACAPLSATPGVGTRSQTRQVELNATEVSQAPYTSDPT